MQCRMRWLSFTVCFMVFAASKSVERTEPPLIPFRAKGTSEPPVVPFSEEELEVDGDDCNQMKDEDEEDVMAPPARDFMDTNPDVVDGRLVFEGDIVFTEKQWRSIEERKGLASSSYRWPEGSDGFPLVSYIFDTNANLDRATIVEGMNHWMEHTCIMFEETTNSNQPHLKYIYGGGCYSYMGKLEQNGQDISIGRGCNDIDTVAHEIGHAMGFSHEQSRPNRDNYMVINLENINPDKKFNFNKYSTSYINDQNVEYDYSSVMHYSPTAFSNNGKTTIATKDPINQPLVGKASGLSHRDKQLANIMYGCIDKWLASCGVSSDPCQNGGYYGANCACVCPAGTSGSSCETVTGDYYDSLRNSCTENITEEGTITSPNYPNNYPAVNCIKWIKAPESYVPKLTFSYFKLYKRNPYCSSNNCCYFDALEIRRENMNYGDVFCDLDIEAGQSFTGNNRDIILFFRTRTNFYRGFSAELTFVPEN